MAIELNCRLHGTYYDDYSCDCPECLTELWEQEDE